ncbi:hypothetical protein ACL6C3_27720 [Capilliphycus salinus ALCB114379]|uniref:hypothetical protein n=1 Tax=Capilliphycus salinus TaxID=2768948 RepID=UPI0039A55AC0
MKTALIQEKPGKLNNQNTSTHPEESLDSSVEIQDKREDLETVNPFSDWDDNPFDPDDLEDLGEVYPQEKSAKTKQKPLEEHLDEQPEVEVEKPKKNYLFTPQVALSLLAIFGSVYVITRPCVIGECQVIDIAKEQAQKSQETIQNVTTSQAPGIAKEELDSAIKQLKRIPFWSPYHRQSRALLSVYNQESKELEFVVKALWIAGLASEEAQNPPYEVEEWDKIKTRWEEAIAQLQQVPPENIIYPFAQARLEQYRANLTEVRGRLALERQAGRTLADAKKAAQVAQARQGVARGVESWQLVYDTWQNATNTLASVAPGTTAYQEAQLLLARYQPQLEDARDRKTIEQVGLDAYNRAVSNADQAKIFAERGAWSDAVKYWSQAVTFGKRVPMSSSYHVEMQPLMTSYTESWKQAEAENKVATRVNTARQDLKTACTGSPTICSYSVSRDLITIRLAPNYVEKIEETALTGDRSGNPEKRNEAEKHVQTLKIALESISDNAQIPLEVYKPNGEKIGVHIPNS